MTELSTKEKDFLANVAKWLVATKGVSAMNGLTAPGGLESAMSEYTQSLADFRTKLMTSDKAFEALTIQIYYDVRTEETAKRNAELKRDALQRLFI